MTDHGRAPEGPGAAAPAPVTVAEPAGPPIHELCPFLLSADGGWRSVTAAREHRCTAVTPPSPLATEKQRRLCLTAEHASCATYLAAGEARPDGARSSERRRPVARTTPLVLDQGRFALAIPSFDATPGAGQAILIGLLGIAFVLVLLARIASGGGGSPAGAVIPLGSATANPGATDGAVATEAATAEPEATDEATAEPDKTLVPTEVQPDPDATAETPKTYKVRKGDTLSAIAARFETTVKKLVKLNKIEDASKIRVGQVLELP